MIGDDVSIKIPAINDNTPASLLFFPKIINSPIATAANIYIIIHQAYLNVFLISLTSA